MATSKKSRMSIADEDAAFFRNAYKNDPKARAAMERDGYKPTSDNKKKTPAKKTGRK